MADEDEDGDDKGGTEAAVAIDKDIKENHGSYAAAMRRRTALHDALIDADYKRGYVSMEESPGEDHKPMITHRISYSHLSDRKKRCELVQTFKDHKGRGETNLLHDKPSDNKITGSAPAAY